MAARAPRSPPSTPRCATTPGRAKTRGRIWRWRFRYRTPSIGRRLCTPLPRGPMRPSTLPTTRRSAAITRGTRPYCRQLIAEGVTDEKELLAKVKAAFPDKPFAIGDVRGQLRVAGKLQWTKRKKQG